MSKDFRALDPTSAIKVLAKPEISMWPFCVHGNGFLAVSQSFTAAIHLVAPASLLFLSPIPLGTDCL
jgi:hypothetical protein